MKNDNPQILAEMVDRLAVLKAMQADLAAEEKTLKESLTSSGLDRVDGTLHRATISHVDGRTMIDWKTIAEKFGPSRQLIQAHTSQAAGYVALKIFARG
jgi:hypothetical protein